MKIKRPLCAAALVLFLILLAIPADIWMRSSCLSEGRGSPAVLTGRVTEIYPGGVSVALGGTEASDDGLILVYFDEPPDVKIGNTVEISGGFTLYEIDEPTNPGQFDFKLYYQTKGIVLTCYADTCLVVDGGCNYARQFLYELRENISAGCAIVFGEYYGGTVSAMLLGDKSGIDDDAESLYQNSGMSHLLAISGLHVSIFGMSAYRILRKLGCSFPAAGIPAILLVISYGVFTGLGTSTLRAVIMCVVSIAADIIGRTYDVLSALALAAILLMLDEPLYVRNASFLLSFGAVIGVALIFPLLKELFISGRRAPDALLIGVSVELMLLPLLEYFYYQVPVYSVVLNLIVVPLVPAVMYLGTAALALNSVCRPLGRIAALPCRCILMFFEAAGNLSLRLPGAVFTCGKPDIRQVIIYYLGISAFVAWRLKVRADRRMRIRAASLIGDDDLEEEREEEHLLKKRAGTAAAAVLLIAVLTVRFGGGFSVTMLDVGQGDGIIIRSGAGTTVLIDGGSSSESGVGTYRIIPFLKSQGVGKLDYCLVTHADSDHISGIEELLEAAASPGGLKVGALLISAQALTSESGGVLAALAAEAGTEVIEISRGMRLCDAAVSLDFLYPVDGAVYGDQNACSCVVKLTYGEFTMLFTGDLEEEGEQEILAFGDAVDCDVLKVGHHGSKTSSSEAFLEAVSPAVSLISCGEDNSYGHPHEETLERLEAAGSEIFVTVDCGAITVRSDGTDFTVTAFRSPEG